MHVREHRRHLGLPSISPSVHALFRQNLPAVMRHRLQINMQSLVQGSTDGVKVWVQWNTFQHP